MQSDFYDEPDFIDAHFHWFPRGIEQDLARVRGIEYLHDPDGYDLNVQLEHLDTTGSKIAAVCSGGVPVGQYAEIEASAARDLTGRYNDEMARFQKAHPGRFWGAAILPLQDTQMAMDELERAIENLGLIGVCVPGSIGHTKQIDDPDLWPFYERVEQLGVPIFLHPTDTTFAPILEGYEGALHLALGRAIDVSVCAFRLILSGIMERHPSLKVVISHIGGALPYQAGRLDKNSTRARLPELPSTYLKRMFTDTVSPRSEALQFALKFFGSDHVMYGSDYPCWRPAAALGILDEVTLSAEERKGVSSGNARRILGLDRQPARPRDSAGQQVGVGS